MSIHEVPLFEAAGAGIARVEVRRLFGRYDYVIEPTRFADADLSRFLILYGDNGTGKTTILRLLFNVLSPALNRGHRTQILRTKFNQFRVVFRDGRIVEVGRPNSEVTGPYEIRLVDAFGDETSSRYVPTDDEDVSREFDRFISQLSDVVPETIYYMGDDRRLESDALDREPSPVPGRRGRVHTQAGEIVYIDEPPRPGAADLLELSLRRTALWIREQVIGASNVGSLNSNRLYAEIAERIATPFATDAPVLARSIDEVVVRAMEVGARNAQFHEVGLTSEIPIETIITALRQVPPEREAVLLEVIQPFLQSVETRLEALADLYETLTTFVEEMNSFFTGKRVEVTVAEGVKIVDSDDLTLEPEALSSGEKQLLLLLTSTFYARASGALYIIDEPELSLNMKWQRRLIDALARVTRGSGTSFVMASHSFELMAGARERVVHLDPSETLAR